MAETTASRTANFILSLAHKRGVELTNLKLQKLLYYAQAWHLAILDKPLFEKRIEAWVHGPVVPPIFGSFKTYRWNPLPDPGETFIESGDPTRPIPSHLIEVFEAYGTFTGPELETLTHQEDPWRLARKGMAPDESSNEIISHQSMIDFYKPKIRYVA